MKPTTPKLLPWLASKAGIEFARSEALWQEATRYASHRAAADTHEHHRIAMNRLLELVAAESLRADAASFGWRPISRAQNRLWAASLQLMESASLLAHRSWRAWGQLA